MSAAPRSMAMRLRAARSGARRVVRTVLFALAAAALGCARTGPTHMLDAAGPQAGHIATLITSISAFGLVVYVAVLVVTGVALHRGRRRRLAVPGPDPVDPMVQAEAERRALRRIGWAAAASAVVLIAHTALSAMSGRRLAALGDGRPGPGGTDPGPLTIQVTGRQWWWEFQYQDPDFSRRLTTANEIHIPVGRAVQFVGTASDVIHSFWIPNLHGKQDLIPGHYQATVLRADTAGRWIGECGEFCGYQHAHMRFVVVAESPERFARWYEAQLAPANEPGDSSARKGRDVFLAHSCVTCHTIDGTLAGGKVGPTLTHVASRATLAAGTLPNTRGHLAGWILAPQRIKPGVRMPDNQLGAADLDALLDYLQSLR